MAFTSSSSTDVVNYESVTIQPRFSALVIGALACLALQMFLLLLGSGIGLSAIDIEKGGIPGEWEIAAGVYLIVALVISFFVGGYITGRLANQSFRVSTVIHGFGMWALASLVVVFLISNTAFSIMGTLLKHAGLGVESASATSSLLKELGELNPRLVSDVKLLKGKVVTRLVTDQPPPKATELGKTTGKDIKRSVKSLTKKPEVKAEIKETTGEVRKASAKGSLFACLALALEALVSVAGAMVARRPLMARVPIGKAGDSSKKPEPKVA